MFRPSATALRFCLFVAGLVVLCVGEQVFLSGFSASVEGKAMSSSDIMTTSPDHRLNLMLIKDHDDKCLILFVSCHQIKKRSNVQAPKRSKDDRQFQDQI